jgi:uncharacterized protein
MSRVEEIKDFVIERFFKHLPNGLYYHNLAHTLDVFEATLKIGQAEGLSDKEIELLRVAALFHDTGFIDVYENNEDLGAEFAEACLPKFGYSITEIEKIKGAILATNLGIEPKNLFEKVLCDSDLDYLGRDDFESRSNLLFEELKFWGKIDSLAQWNKLQIEFLAGPHFYTNYSLKNRAPQVADNFKKVSCE